MNFEKINMQSLFGVFQFGVIRIRRIMERFPSRAATFSTFNAPALKPGNSLIAFDVGFQRLDTFSKSLIKAWENIPIVPAHFVLHHLFTLIRDHDTKKSVAHVFFRISVMTNKVLHLQSIIDQIQERNVKIDGRTRTVLSSGKQLDPLDALLFVIIIRESFIGVEAIEELIRFFCKSR